MAISRRHFFYGSLLAGAVPSGGFGSTPSLKMMGYKSPNEKLNIASIGAGGKASSDIDGCKAENLVALCDVDAKQAANKYKQYPNVPKFKDFRKMLDAQGKDIDACIVTIPDFMHATAAIACTDLPGATSQSMTDVVISNSLVPSGSTFGASFWLPTPLVLGPFFSCAT